MIKNHSDNKMLLKQKVNLILIFLILAIQNSNPRLVNPRAAAIHQPQIQQQVKQNPVKQQTQKEQQEDVQDPYQKTSGHNLDYDNLDAEEYAKQLREELENYNDPNNKKSPSQHHRQKERKDPSQLKETHDHLTNQQLSELATEINNAIREDQNLRAIIIEITKIKNSQLKAEKMEKVIQLVNAKIAEIAEEDPYNLSERSSIVQNAQKHYDELVRETMNHNNPESAIAFFEGKVSGVGKLILKYGGELLVFTGLLHEAEKFTGSDDKKLKKEIEHKTEEKREKEEKANNEYKDNLENEKKEFYKEQQHKIDKLNKKDAKKDQEERQREANKLKERNREIERQQEESQKAMQKQREEKPSKKSTNEKKRKQKQSKKEEKKKRKQQEAEEKRKKQQQEEQIKEQQKKIEEYESKITEQEMQLKEQKGIEEKTNYEEPNLFDM
jgi:hypothetical protein